MSARQSVEVARPRRAQLIAEAVAVCCPFCGEPQPNHFGSEMWTPQDFARSASVGMRECVSCEARILIAHDPRVQFPAPVQERTAAIEAGQ